MRKQIYIIIVSCAVFALSCCVSVRLSMTPGPGLEVSHGRLLLCFTANRFDSPVLVWAHWNPVIPVTGFDWGYVARTHWISIPMWVCVVVIAAFGSCIISYIDRLYKHRAYHCVACGYCLEGLRTHMCCPECGKRNRTTNERS